jgi:hypothetical protein
MKKIFFCIVSTLLISNMQAQNFSFKAFGVSAGVNSTNVILGATDAFTQPKGSITTVQAGLSYGLNLDATFSMSKRLNLNVGAAFNTFNFKQSISGLKWGVDNDNGAYSPSITALKSNMTALNIPIKCEFLINKMSGLVIGIAPSFRLDKKADLTITRISTSKELDAFSEFLPVKSLNLISSISYIQRIKLTDKINLKLEPIVSLHILGDELYLNYTQNRFYQLGINVGIEFQHLSKRENDKLTKKKIGA